MPDASKFAGHYSAEPPRVFIQPHLGHMPPRIFVGNTVIEVSDKGRAAQWARILIDYVLSGVSRETNQEQGQ